MARSRLDRANRTSTTHIYVIDLDCASARHDELANVLSASERAHAERFRFPKDGRRWRVARGAMRSILAGRIGCEPQHLAFQTGQYGKPALDDTDASRRLHFNLSHSGARALLAINETAALGVDIEQRRDIVDMERVARKFFAAAEYAALLDLPKDARQAGFLNCWTRKEAVIKATGEGLSARLDSFEVSLASQARNGKLIRSSTSAPLSDASLFNLTLDDAYTGAVCILAPGRHEIVMRRFK